MAGVRGCCCEGRALVLGSLQALSLVLAPAPPAPLPLSSVDERRWLCRSRLVVDSQTHGSSSRWRVPAGSAVAGVWGPRELLVATLSWEQAARWHQALTAQLLLRGHVAPWASRYSQPSCAFPPSPRPGLKAPSLCNTALSACSGCHQCCNICSPCHLLPSNSFFY